MSNLPTADWCTKAKIAEVDRPISEYQAACRAQFRTLAFTHDLCLDEDGPGRKVGEAAFLVEVPGGRGLYGCFWLGHQDPAHCYFELVPHNLFVMPKLITLKRVVIELCEDSGIHIVSVPGAAPDEPNNLLIAWLIDEGTDDFSLRCPDKGKLNQFHEVFSGIGMQLDLLSVDWEEITDGYTFKVSDDLDRQLLEYSFPPE